MPSTPPAHAPQPANSAHPSTLSVTDSLAKPLSSASATTKALSSNINPKPTQKSSSSKPSPIPLGSLYRISGLENSLFTLGIAEHEASVDTEHSQVLNALAMAKTYREHNQVVANLGMHGQRLARLFKETLKQLREIQTERRSEEKEQLKNAAIIMEMHKDAGVPYDPAQDGFVFSKAEIDTCIQRNVRLTQARRADLHRPCPPPSLTLHARI